jgi:hypothetical protein
MSSPQKTYRVYSFDKAHSIVSADWLEAVSDEDAIAKAKERGFGSQCEIWEGKRLVAELSEEERRSA